MKHTATSLIVLAVIGGPAWAQTPSAADQQVEELTELVARMQEEIRALQAADSDDWLTEQRAEEIRGLVQDVLADADTRASLLQSGTTAGYDKKFFMASADGRFRLNLEGQVQIRYVYNNQDDGTDGANTLDSNRSGFEVRRAKLAFSGHVVDPSWTYKIQGGFERNRGDFVSDDVLIAKGFDNGWQIQVGQFKAPFLREELVSSKRQLLVDRSLVNERWNQDRSIGVQASYEGDQFRVSSMYHNGLGRNLGLDLRSRRGGWDREDTEFAIATRAEFLLAGAWSQFKDFTSWRGSDTAVMIGAAVNYQKQEYGTSGNALPQVPPGVDNELEDLRLTADISLEGDGWSAFAAFVWTDFDNDTPSSDPNHIDASPWGVVLQGGYFLTDEWEIFCRYEFGDDDDLGSEDLSVITLGANRYFNKHGLKWTTDVGIGLDAVESSWGPQLGVGWREDRAGEDTQVVVRSQVQLLF